MSSRSKLILPGGRSRKKQLVRNPGTGRVLPCTWQDCEDDGDNRFQIRVPHDSPKFDGEKLIYIFCGEPHRQMYARSNPHKAR